MSDARLPTPQNPSMSVHRTEGRRSPERRVAPSGRGRILTTRVGLQFPATTTFSDWERAGPMIARIVDSSAWCLGDWLVYGQERYAERYQTAVAAAGLDYQTLRNYAWVARRFEWSRRREELSFQHHAEVASMPPEEQDRWLRRAVDMAWSRNQLRREIRSARQGESDGPSKVVLPRVQVPSDYVERWRKAAEHSSSDLQQWVVDTLEAAAGRILDVGDEPHPESPLDRPGHAGAAVRPRAVGEPAARVG